MNKKSNIIVTGGMGFIGYEIVQAYINQGYKVFVIDNCSNLLVSKKLINFEFFPTDLRDKKKIESIISSVKPEIINHHAAHIDVNNSLINPGFDAENNILTTINLLEASRRFVKKFIFSSSGGAVYDPSKPEPFTENSRIAPSNPYGIAKASCEQYIRLYSQLNHFQSLIFRYSNVYGPTQIHNKYRGVIIKFATQILNKEPVTIDGDGKQSRDFVYIDDVVRANLLALDFETDSAIFNIGSGKKSSMIQILEILTEKSSSELQISFTQKSPGVTSNCLDISLARTKLEYSPIFSLEKGLSDLMLQLPILLKKIEA